MILFLNYREIIEKLKKTIRNSNYSKNYLCVTRPLGKGVMKICSKFNAEQTCQSVISIKLLSNFIEITLRHGCSFVNLLHIFRAPFPKNTSRWLLIELTHFQIFSLHSKSSCPEVFCEKAVLKNFAKFTEKCLCHSLFLSKVASLRPGTGTCVLLWIFQKIFKNTNFYADMLKFMLTRSKYMCFKIKVDKN